MIVVGVVAITKKFFPEKNNNLFLVKFLSYLHNNEIGWFFFCKEGEEEEEWEDEEESEEEVKEDEEEDKKGYKKLTSLCIWSGSSEDFFEYFRVAHKNPCWSSISAMKLTLLMFHYQ